MRGYSQIVVGIDQSYKNTGISIVADGKLKDIKSVRLDKYPCNTVRREVLKFALEHLMSAVAEKSDEIVCMVERTRVHGGVGSFVNIDVIKSMGSLTALVVDVMYQYGVDVYSVDTRSWKSQVVGTSKPVSNTFGVPSSKWPTVKWVVDQGFGNKILVDVTHSRRQKGVFEVDGKKYMYNDDAADSAAIAMYYVVGDRSKIRLER